MDVLTSPCFLKQWQLKVISSKWGMSNLMTAKKGTQAAHRHSWWCQSRISLLFPIWNLMGILILRSILKINKSISSKKPFAWVRANVQSVRSVCSEMCTQPEMCTRWLMKKWSRLHVFSKFKIHASSQKKKKKSLIMITKLLQKIDLLFQLFYCFANIFLIPKRFLSSGFLLRAPAFVPWMQDCPGPLCTRGLRFF